MCCCMAFLSYFAFCSALYFRVGSVPDAASLVLFATECLILLFTCVQFYRDPCSFDYFRFSFALSQLAMNHYFLHMLCLLTCSVLLVAMSEIAVAALVPLAVMLLYTALYRPYKQTRDNLRSCFNLLVMCSLAGFRVLVQFTPQNQLAGNLVMAMFMVNFVVLLPMVVIMGLVASIY